MWACASVFTLTFCEKNLLSKFEAKLKTKKKINLTLQLSNKLFLSLEMEKICSFFPRLKIDRNVQIAVGVVSGLVATGYILSKIRASVRWHFLYRFSLLLWLSLLLTLWLSLMLTLRLPLMLLLYLMLLFLWCCCCLWCCYCFWSCYCFWCCCCSFCWCQGHPCWCLWSCCLCYWWCCCHWCIYCCCCLYCQVTNGRIC